MRLEPFVLVATSLAFLGVWLLMWRLLGVYRSEGAESAIRPGDLITVIDWRRLQGEVVDGYLDSLNVFHSHFYEIRVRRPEAPARLVVVRYIPDAFGKPLRGRLGGHQINWWKRPDLMAIQLGGSRILIWRERGADRVSEPVA